MIVVLDIKDTAESLGKLKNLTGEFKAGRIHDYKDVMSALNGPTRRPHGDGPDADLPNVTLPKRQPRDVPDAPGGGTGTVRPLPSDVDSPSARTQLPVKQQAEKLASYLGADGALGQALVREAANLPGGKNKIEKLYDDAGKLFGNGPRDAGLAGDAMLDAAKVPHASRRAGHQALAGFRDGAGAIGGNDLINLYESMLPGEPNHSAFKRALDSAEAAIKVADRNQAIATPASRIEKLSIPDQAALLTNDTGIGKGPLAGAMKDELQHYAQGRPKDAIESLRGNGAAIYGGAKDAGLLGRAAFDTLDLPQSNYGAAHRALAKMRGDLSNPTAHDVISLYEKVATPGSPQHATFKEMYQANVARDKSPANATVQTGAGVETVTATAGTRIGIPLTVNGSRMVAELRELQAPDGSRYYGWGTKDQAYPIPETVKVTRPDGSYNLPVVEQHILRQLNTGAANKDGLHSLDDWNKTQVENLRGRAVGKALVPDETGMLQPVVATRGAGAAVKVVTAGGESMAVDIRFLKTPDGVEHLGFGTNNRAYAFRDPEKLIHNGELDLKAAQAEINRVAAQGLINREAMRPIKADDPVLGAPSKSPNTPSSGNTVAQQVDSVISAYKVDGPLARAMGTELQREAKAQGIQVAVIGNDASRLFGNASGEDPAGLFGRAVLKTLPEQANPKAANMALADLRRQFESGGDPSALVTRLEKIATPGTPERIDFEQRVTKHAQTLNDAPGSNRPVPPSDPAVTPQPSRKPIGQNPGDIVDLGNADPQKRPPPGKEPAPGESSATQDNGGSGNQPPRKPPGNSSGDTPPNPSEQPGGNPGNDNPRNRSEELAQRQPGVPGSNPESRLPEPMIVNGKRWDVVGIAEGNPPSLNLISSNSVPRFVPEDALVPKVFATGDKPGHGRAVTLIENGERTDYTLTGVKKNGLELTRAGESGLEKRFVPYSDAADTAKVEFKFSNGAAYIAKQTTLGSVRFDPLDVQTANVPLTPGTRFEARLLGRELEGPKQIEVQGGNRLVAYDQRPGKDRVIGESVGIGDVAPTWVKVRSTESPGVDLYMDSYAHRRAGFRSGRDGDPPQILGTLDKDTKILYDFSNELYKPVVSALRDPQTKGDVHMMMYKMDTTPFTKHITDAFLSYADRNPENKVTIHSSNSTQINGHKGEDLKKWLRENHPNVEIVDPLLPQSNRVTHTKMIYIDDTVYLSTERIGPRGSGKLGATVIIEGEPANLLHDYMKMAANPSQKNVTARHDALNSLAEKHGILIDGPVEGVFSNIAVVNKSLAESQKWVRMFQSDLMDVEATKAIVATAKRGVDIEVRYREIDPESKKILDEASKQYPNLKQQQISDKFPGLIYPHGNHVVTEKGGLISTAFTWEPKAQQVPNPTKGWESGVVLDADQALKFREVLEKAPKRTIGPAALMDYTYEEYLKKYIGYLPTIPDLKERLFPSSKQGQDIQPESPPSSNIPLAPGTRINGQPPQSDDDNRRKLQSAVPEVTVIVSGVAADGGGQRQTAATVVALDPRATGLLVDAHSAIQAMNDRMRISPPQSVADTLAPMVTKHAYESGFKEIIRTDINAPVAEKDGSVLPAGTNLIATSEKGQRVAINIADTLQKTPEQAMLGLHSTVQQNAQRQPSSDTPVAAQSGVTQEPEQRGLRMT